MTSVHNADAASGLARDLAFNTKHLGITLADGGPGFRDIDRDKVADISSPYTLIIPPWAIRTLGNPDFN
jgi:hypothetical protein